VSRGIRDLEDELGLQLFERIGKTVRLTDAGFSFLKEARAVLERTDEAMQKARAFAQAGETELHIAYSPLLRAKIVSPALHAFQQAMPRVHVKLHDATTGKKGMTDLRDGRFHLAFIARPSKRGAFHDLRFEELLRQQVLLGVAPGHPLAQLRSVSLTDAAKEPFISLAREDFPEYNAYLSAVFAQVKNKPRVIEEYDNMMGLISAIEAGTGVGMVVDLVVQNFGSRVEPVRLTPEPKPISFGLAARKGRLSPATEKFWQCAKEVASQG
jgi:DNA-binding transcriptional LysR family regulator